jgi:hypothetical protein
LPAPGCISSTSKPANCSGRSEAAHASSADPHVAAGFLEKAADLQAKSNKAPDASPQAPDVEPANR